MLRRGSAARHRGWPADFENLVEAPARHLAAACKPDATGAAHVADDGAQRIGAAGPPGNVGMELERTVGRRRFGFVVEFVEHRLPDHERALRIAGVVVAVLIGGAVAERPVRPLIMSTVLRITSLSSSRVRLRATSW